MNALTHLTHPLRTPQRETQPETQRETPEHLHAWRTESSHSTSEGVVRYAHCPRCGGRRVELTPIAGERSPLTEVARTPRAAGTSRAALPTGPS